MLDELHRIVVDARDHQLLEDVASEDHRRCVVQRDVPNGLGAAVVNSGGEAVVAPFDRGVAAAHDSPSLGFERSLYFYDCRYAMSRFCFMSRASSTVRPMNSCGWKVSSSSNQANTKACAPSSRTAFASLLPYRCAES